MVLPYNGCALAARGVQRRAPRVCYYHDFEVTPLMRLALATS